MTDGELIAAFEAGHVPEGRFRHEEHVRVAWFYLGEASTVAALDRFITSLKRFAAAQNTPGLYHETVTVAYMLLIQDRIARGGRGASWEEFAARNPELFNQKPSLLEQYYSSELLASQTARASFVWPDLL
jgi:hypothetical protein